MGIVEFVTLALFFLTPLFFTSRFIILEHDIFGLGSKDMRKKYSDVTEFMVAEGLPRLPDVWYAVDVSMSEPQVLLVKGPKVVRTLSVRLDKYSELHPQIMRVMTQITEDYLEQTRREKREKEYFSYLESFSDKNVIVTGGYAKDNAN